MQADTQLPTTPPLSGADLVAKVNAIVETLATDFSGTTDPAALAWAFASWADTGNGVLKRRNAANSAWITIGRLLNNHVPVFQLGEIPTTNIGPISVEGIGPYEWDGSKYVIATLRTGAYTTAAGKLAIDFLGIPSWARRVSINLTEVSTDGTSAIVLQAGTVSGVVSSGYDDSAARIMGSTAATVSSGGIGFTISYVSSATNESTGRAVLEHVGSNVWVCSGATTITTQNGITSFAGRVQLGSALDRIRLLTFNGSDQFDSGAVNVLWE